MIKPKVLVNLIFLLVGCGQVPLPLGTNGGSRGGEDATQLFDRVSSEELNSMEFRVSGVRVGLQDYFSYQTPFVIYTLPEKSDFAEVLRCSSELKISGQTDSVEIRSVEIGYGFFDQQKLFQENDFWKSAKDAGCKSIATGVVESPYYDAFASDGEFFYITRACVLPEKVLSDPQTSDNSDSFCSRVLSTTSQISYKNLRTAAQKATLAEANAISDKAFGLTRQAVSIASQLFSEVTKCEVDKKANERKSNILDWLQTGIGWVKVLFPVFQIAVPVDLQKAAQGIEQLNILFGLQLPKIPASCQFAADLQTKGTLLATEIEAVQKQYISLYGKLNETSQQ